MADVLFSTEERSYGTIYFYYPQSDQAKEAFALFMEEPDEQPLRYGFLSRQEGYSWNEHLTFAPKE